MQFIGTLTRFARMATRSSQTDPRRFKIKGHGFSHIYHLVPTLVIKPN